MYFNLNRISDVFKIISAEKEAQFRYLELLVEHLRVGIITIDETGTIQLANQALKNLLQKEVLINLRSLESFDALLVNTLREIRSGETRLVKLRIQNEMLQLSIHASEFRLEDRYHKLISMQNIRNELDAREMEAWQKLIRVLTHEIMNSVAPVISLSETMHALVQRNANIPREASAELNATLEKGLDAINARSKGLYNFTQSYRKLTGIPKLTLQDTTTTQIILRVATLMENNIHERGITLRTSNIDHPITVDADLIEQVLINL